MTEQRVQTMVSVPAVTEPSAQPAFWHEAAALQQAIQQPLRDPTAAYLGGLRETSRAAGLKRLRSVARLIGVDAATMPWHELRFVHIEFIRQKMIDAEAAPATVNATLSALGM